MIVFKKREGCMAFNRKASKKHSEFTYVENRGEICFDRYIRKYGEKRLMNRILNGRSVNPCDMECEKFACMVAKNFNHSGLENFKFLMNDKEFLIKLAKITPNPIMCENYFYLYVNPYLKKDASFRLNFLKAIYMNENVYKLEDINSINELCGFEKENEQLLNDEGFRILFEKRIENFKQTKKLQYHLSGLDKEEVKNYKVLSNEEKVHSMNVLKGLYEILQTFAVVEKTEEIETNLFAIKTKEQDV